MPAVAGPKVCGASASTVPLCLPVLQWLCPVTVLAVSGPECGAGVYCAHHLAPDDGASCCQAQGVGPVCAMPGDGASCCQAQCVGPVCTVPATLCQLLPGPACGAGVYCACHLVPAVARPRVWGQCVLCQVMVPGPECGAGMYCAHHLVPGDGARCWLGCSGCTVLDCGCFV